MYFLYSLGGVTFNKCWITLSILNCYSPNFQGFTLMMECSTLTWINFIRIKNRKKSWIGELAAINGFDTSKQEIALKCKINLRDWQNSKNDIMHSYMYDYLCINRILMLNQCWSTWLLNFIKGKTTGGKKYL